jgi:enediyne biosynthesis protein E4
MKQNSHYIVVILCVLICAGCAKKDEKLFRMVPSSHSGITFKNNLTESVDFNIFNYMYFYNGGGVAVGDFNGDDLMDIYFTANQEPNKLYLNRGDLKFQDITTEAGVQGVNGWTTGVTVADVNADGRLDIYVSYIGDYLIYKGHNQLFINEGNGANGIPKFTDRAVEYGLDLVGFSTQASFLDYDRDGDLDMFMLNHSLHQQGTFGKSNLRKESHALAGDRLLRNDNGHFIDVTATSGIYSSVLGYGLGVVASDVNLDGWPDIYVGNDFHENDYLYINKGDGTFTEVLEQSMLHTSRYTMGVDFADFNNDAFPDLISMDMLPEDPLILKSSQAEDAYDVYSFKLNFGYNHQFARNVLQLNNQDGTFSDIALLAGVSATDWSWSSLFADFDLDGHKDIFVANGILRRSNDLDYINFIEVDSIQHMLNDKMGDRELKYTEKMPKIKIPNALFINNHDSTFTNKTAEWGLDKPAYSNGAVYADLDNDGDMDLIVNNVQDEAFIYENRSIEEEKKTERKFLRISLKGKQANIFGIGAKVFVYDSGNLQMQECMPTRGYQSAVDYRLIFGVTRSSSLDSVVVIWNDGTFQKLENVSVNQHVIIDQAHASGNYDYSRFHRAEPLFKRSSSDINIPFKHEENRFVEFNREQLIPHMMSAEGPALAVGDVNGDEREDIYIGGGKWQTGAIYIQQQNGKFTLSNQPLLIQDSTYEDVDAIYFDADGDRDNDLFVVSGGNEFTGKSRYRNPRLYINDGKGVFSRSNALNDVFTTGSCVAASDIDMDGDVDLFLGSRALPWRYGIKPDSYLFINDGKGNFSNVTATHAPALQKFGFVKQAIWADVDNDQDPDLIVAAEWAPITIFKNTNGKLELLSHQDTGLQDSNGWWNVVHAVDYDSDGDVDFIAGNLGLNSKLQTSPNTPVRMFVGDFDKNDSTDQILTHFIRGKEYPFHTRDEMTKQMPYLKKRYLSYHKFSEATVHEMFGKANLEKAQQYSAFTFQTSLIENNGNGKFQIHPLPKAAQFSTVSAILTDDFNNDGNVDMMLGGNFYPVNIQMGRYDASYGLILTGDGKGNFKPMTSKQSGFSVSGEIRKFRPVRIGNSVHYLAMRNSDTLEAFTLRK